MNTKKNLPATTGTETKTKTFLFNKFEVRTVEKDGSFWFVAKDVSDALGYTDTNKMTCKLDGDEKITAKMAGISKTNPTAVIISESGLYSAILRSTKPEAKHFKKWVTSEVLPALRREGTYTGAPTELPNKKKLSIAGRNAVQNAKVPTLLEHNDFRAELIATVKRRNQLTGESIADMKAFLIRYYAASNYTAIPTSRMKEAITLIRTGDYLLKTDVPLEIYNYVELYNEVGRRAQRTGEKVKHIRNALCSAFNVANYRQIPHDMLPRAFNWLKQNVGWAPKATLLSAPKTEKKFDWDMFSDEVMKSLDGTTDDDWIDLNTGMAESVAKSLSEGFGALATLHGQMVLQLKAMSALLQRGAR